MQIKTTNKSKDGVLRIACSTCDGHTNHAVLLSVECHDNSPDGEYQSHHDYQIVQCRGCETISFRHNYTDTEDNYYNEEMQEWEPSDHERLYPPRIDDRKHLRHVYYLPGQLRKIYDETLGALANQHNILAAIGIRALLEVTTQTLGAKKGSLQARIDALVKSGSITKESADLLHATRLLGNMAAHEVTPIPVDDLSSALDIVENLLQSTFIVPHTARMLTKKYKQKPKSTPKAKKEKAP